MKRIVSLFLGINLVCLSYSQTNAPLKNWDETTKSISQGNQSSNEKNKDVSSLNMSGDMTLSVPVVTIQSRTMSIPITANYAAGIKVDQQASEIGLGWSINFGSIVRDYGAFEPDYTATSPEAEMIDADGFNPDGWIGNHNPNRNNRSLDYNGVAANQMMVDDYYVSMPGGEGNSFFNKGAINQPHDFVFSQQTTWKLDHSVKTYSISQEFSRINEFNLQESNSVQIDQQSGDKYLTGKYSYAAAIGLLPYVKNQYFFSAVATANPGGPSGFNPTAQQRTVTYEDFESFTITTGDGTRYVYGRPLRGQKYMMNEDPYWSSLPGTVNEPFEGSMTEHWKMDYIAEWLLTEILSVDYQDLNGNGIPDEGDGGDWIRIEYTASTKSEQLFVGGGSGQVPMHREWMGYSQTDRASSLMRERAYVKRIVTPVQEIDFTTSERYDVDHDYYSKPANYINNYNYVYADLKMGINGSKSDFDVAYPVETMRYDTVRVKDNKRDNRLYDANKDLNTVVFKYAIKGSSKELAVSEYLIRNNDNVDKGLLNPNIPATLNDFNIEQYKSLDKRGKTTLLAIEYYPQDNTETAQPDTYEFEYAFNPSYNEIHKREIVRKRFFPSKRQSMSSTAQPPVVYPIAYSDDNGQAYSSTDPFGVPYAGSKVSPYEFLTQIPYVAKTHQYVTQGAIDNQNIQGTVCSYFVNNNQMPSPNAAQVATNINSSVMNSVRRDEMGYYRSNNNDPDIDRAAWSLTQVTVPKKGLIGFEYEADRVDYSSDKANWTIKDDGLPLISQYNEIAKGRSLRQDLFNKGSKEGQTSANTMPDKLLEATFDVKMNNQSGGLRLKSKTLDDGVNTPVIINYEYGDGHYSSVPADYWSNLIDAFSAFTTQQRWRFNSEAGLYNVAYTTVIVFGYQATANLGWTTTYDQFLAPYLRNIKIDRGVNGIHYYNYITEVYANGSKVKTTYGAIDPNATGQKDSQKLIPLKTYADKTHFGCYAIVQEESPENTTVELSELSYESGALQPYLSKNNEYEWGQLAYRNLSTVERNEITNQTHFCSIIDDENIGLIGPWSYYPSDKLLFNQPAFNIGATTFKRQQSAYIREKKLTQTYKGIVSTKSFDYIPSNGLLRSTTESGNTKITPLGTIEESYKTELTYAYESYQGLTTAFETKNLKEDVSETKRYLISNNLTTQTANQGLLKATVLAYDLGLIVPKPHQALGWRGDINHTDATIIGFQAYDFSNSNNSVNWVGTSEIVQTNQNGDAEFVRSDRLYARSVFGYNSSAVKASIMLPELWFDGTYTGFEDIKVDDGSSVLGQHPDPEFWYDLNFREQLGTPVAPRSIVFDQKQSDDCDFGNGSNAFDYVEPNTTSPSHLYWTIQIDNSDNHFDEMFNNEVHIVFNLAGTSNQIDFYTSIRNIVPDPNGSGIGYQNHKSRLCLSDPFPQAVIDHFMTNYNVNMLGNLAVTGTIELVGPDINNIRSKPSRSYARTGESSFKLAYKGDVNDPSEKTPIRPVKIKAGGSNCITQQGGPLSSDPDCAMPYIASMYVKRIDIQQYPGNNNNSALYESGTVSQTMLNEDLKLVYTLWNAGRTSIIQQGHFYLTNTDQNWRYYEIEIPVVKTGGDQYLDVYLENNMLASNHPFYSIYVDDIMIFPKGAKYGYISQDKFGNITHSTNTNDNTRRTLFDEWGREHVTYDEFDNILSQTEYKTTTNINQAHNYTNTRSHIDNLHFSETREYTDGFDKTIQTMISEPGKNIRTVKTTVTYDNMGRPQKHWLPYALTGSYFQVKANNEYVTETNNLYGSPYAYTEKIYDINSSEEPKQVLMARMASEAPLSIIHTDLANPQPIQVGNLQYPANELRISTVQGQDGSLTVQYIDKLNNAVMVITDIGYDHLISATGAVTFNSASIYKKAESIRMYDGAGNLIKSIDPDGKISEFYYNSLGDLLEKSLPDAGTTRFVYDESGKERFVQDQKDADIQTSSSSEQFKFTQYDGWGRPTYGGVINQTVVGGNYAFNQTNADNPHYPVNNAAALVGVQIHRESTFDGSRHDESEDQLISEIVYSDHTLNGDGTYSPQKTDIWDYTYDERGDMISQSISYDGLANPHKLTYQYNRAGSIVKMEYVHPTNANWNLIQTYQYDDHGRLVKSLSGKTLNDLTVDSENRYDVIGKLFKKSIAPSGNPSAPYHEQIGMLHNIRGEMVAQLGLNFRYLLEYNSNGQITKQLWNNNQLDNLGGSPYILHQYEYSYDKLNRLVGADYSIHESSNNPFSIYQSTEAQNNPSTIIYTPITVVDVEHVLTTVNDMIGIAQNDPDQFTREVVEDLGQVVDIVENEVALMGEDFNTLPEGEKEQLIQRITNRMHQLELQVEQFEMLYTLHLERLENPPPPEENLGFVDGMLKNIQVQIFQNAEINADAIAYGSAYTISDFLNVNIISGTKYDTDYFYQKNGSITLLHRRDESGLLTTQNYTYANPTNNQLTTVNWNENGTQSTTNYAYNPVGSILNNSRANVAGVNYNAYHRLPVSITHTNSSIFHYRYGPDLSRTVKNLGNGNVEYYLDGVILDANGKPLRYDIEDGFAQLDHTDNLYKTYQIKDWLGTVRIGIDEAGQILNTSDHYAFGKAMPQRQYVSSTEASRRGYQQSEKEGYLSESTYSTDFRLLDVELAKWWGADPIMSFGESPYVAMSNNPIMFVDPLGLSSVKPKPWKIFGFGKGGFGRRKYTRGIHIGKGIKAGIGGFVRGMRNLGQRLFLGRKSKVQTLHGLGYTRMTQRSARFTFNGSWNSPFWSVSHNLGDLFPQYDFTRDKLRSIQIAAVNGRPFSGFISMISPAFRMYSLSNPSGSWKRLWSGGSAITRILQTSGTLTGTGATIHGTRILPEIFRLVVNRIIVNSIGAGIGGAAYGMLRLVVNGLTSIIQSEFGMLLPRYKHMNRVGLEFFSPVPMAYDITIRWKDRDIRKDRNDKWYGRFSSSFKWY